MSILSDCHIHSTFSGDGKSTMEEMIQRAISMGLTTITFTEHNDFDYPYDLSHDKQDMFLLNVDSYLYELLKMKSKYEDQIRVLFGIELGLAPEILRKNLIFSRAHEYDFIIGSSHVCHGVDPYYASYYEGRSEKEAYREYFECILENVKQFTAFDVYGHLDYVVRYGPNKDQNYCYEDYQDVIDEILKTLIENEKGIEINTGGFRKGVNITHPCEAIVKRYKELGGEIVTIGSDAHETTYLASDFDKAETMLKNLGFKYYNIFENRLPEYIKLV